MSEPRAWDPYAVLGVGRDASALQVARAHRRLAKRHHPDVNPHAADERAMHRINEAWRVLSSPELRADFDRRHPAAGVPHGTAAAVGQRAQSASRRPASAGHWTATREPVRRGEINPRSYREWQASAGSGASTTWASPHDRFTSQHQSRPSARIQPDSRRGRAVAANPPEFRDSGWAAVLVAAALVGFVLIAAALGGQYWGSTGRDVPPLVKIAD